VVHLAIQLVPQPLAVEFGCCCAEHALPVFAREFPNDDRPPSLTATVRSWLWGEATKTEVRRQLRLMSDVTDEEAAMPQAGQVWSREQEAARYAAVCAARSAAAAALAVSFPQKSNKWEQWVSQAALEAVAAADMLAARDVSCTVAVAASVQPAPVQALCALAHRVRCIATIEGHYRIGGLGTLVAETFSEHGIVTPVIRCGVETLEDGVGSSAFLGRRHGISADRVAERVAAWMDRVVT